MTLKRLIFQILALMFISSAAYSQAREIYIEGHDQMRYTVETIKAKPGETLKITLKTESALDKSQMAHNWVLLKQGTDALNFVTKDCNIRITTSSIRRLRIRLLQKPICSEMARPIR